MKNTMHTPNPTPQNVQGANVGTVARPDREVATLRDVNNALEDAAKRGAPSIADWHHRAVDFRILDRVLEGLDHPVEAFETLFPAEWKNVRAQLRGRIPGNARNNHMRLLATMSRVIGFLRPDLDPWPALQLLADVETPTNADIVGAIRKLAMCDGLKPIEIDSDWIAAQLATIDPKSEAQHRNIFHSLVRLAQTPRVRQSGLLRDDLSLPPTMRQTQCAVTLPTWLQDIYDASGRPAQNGIDRIWRTILHHGLIAHAAEDILTLIDTGKLQYEAAQCVEPIKPGTWRIYIQRVRKAIVSCTNNRAKTF